MPIDVVVHPLDASRREDFYAVLRRGSDDSAKCACTAYCTRDWEKPGAGPACRERFFAEGRSDGYLLYQDGLPVGWCQCGPWSSFELLVSAPPLESDAWAITCIVVVPEARGKGLAHHLFREVLSDLRRRGASSVIAFAHRLGPTYSSSLAELPESLCLKAGMTLRRDDRECPIYGIKLEVSARIEPESEKK